MSIKNRMFYSDDNDYLNSPAILWSDGIMTYKDYFERINKLTHLLKNMGLVSGDRIGIISDIHFHFPLFFFAIIKAGGIVVPINKKFPPSEIDRLFTEINCRWIINLNHVYDVTRNNKQPWYDSDEIYSRIEDLGPVDNFPDPMMDNDATIMMTSGSEGKSKGVLHTISNHYYSALGSNTNIAVYPGDRWSVRLPFHHIAGIAILFRCLISGACCVLPEANEFVWEIINKYKITHTSLVPVQLQRLIASFPKNEKIYPLKSILLGGDKIPESLIHKAMKLHLPVFCSYGSTEMCSQITTTSVNMRQENMFNAGKILPYREIKIENTGMIFVRGKTLCRGYIEGKNIKKITDDDGWFITGDMGYFDKTNNLVVQGRADNMFISAGENIHPEEIENVLLSLDNIIEACVVPIPDNEYGVRPVGFIKLADERDIDQKWLYTSLKKILPPFKIPLTFLPLPEGSGGIKYSRSELRQIALKS